MPRKHSPEVARSRTAAAPVRRSPLGSHLGDHLAPVVNAKQSRTPDRPKSRTAETRPTAGLTGLPRQLLDGATCWAKEAKRP